METVLVVNAKQARRNLAIGGAIFLGAALAAQAFSARADDARREAIYPQAEVTASIAQQGNEAVRRIEREARQAVPLAQPAPLSDLAVIATDVALK